MEYITLNNDVKMPLLGFGTFQLTGQQCATAVSDAIQAGDRLIDTAEAYGNEEAVGQGIKMSGLDRRDLFLATKVNFTSYDDARATVLASMRKLNTDYLDLVLLHWPFGNYYRAWHELEKLYQEKRIRAIGVSNFEPDRLVDLIAYNQMVPAVNQIETNVYCQQGAARKWMAKYGVQPMAYAPLGQGRRNHMFTEPTIVSLAEKYGKTPAQVLLRYLTQRQVIVIPRSTQPKHIQENIAIFDFTMTDAELQAIAALDQRQPLIGNPEDPHLVEAAQNW
ncbi:MAG TPA: aldo/keto reductase [Candidatus Limosilactobacillus intestinigallinarum]|nr:aldo/keto reductase [Candidatus Limosilactobacillus intestinigallinarum]